MEINVFGIAGAAFLGALATALMGWLNTVEPWNWRKITSSLVAGVIAAVGIAAAFDYAGVEVVAIAYLLAFLSGAGVEVGVHRAVGAIRKK